MRTLPDWIKRGHQVVVPVTGVNFGVGDELMATDSPFIYPQVKEGFPVKVVLEDQTEAVLWEVGDLAEGMGKIKAIECIDVRYLTPDHFKAMGYKDSYSFLYDWTARFEDMAAYKKMQETEFLYSVPFHIPVWLRGEANRPYLGWLLTFGG